MLRSRGPAPRFSRSECQVQSPPPHPGQHTDEALRAEDQALQKQRAVLSDEVFAQKRKELQSRLAGQQQQFNERRRRFQASVDKAWFDDY